MGKILRSLKCEVRIVEAKNVEIKSQSSSSLFVRFYLSAGQNRKIEVNTRELCSKSDKLIWDQSFGLECQGNEAAVEELKQKSVVFELRRKKTSSFLRKSSRSEVVGRGEVSWESVFETPSMEIERFVVMNESNLLLKIALEKLFYVCSERYCGSCNCLDYEAFALDCI